MPHSPAARSASGRRRRATSVSAGGGKAALGLYRAVEPGKTYGRGAKAVHALTEVTFAVRPGIVFVLLGPNGAGKPGTQVGEIR